MLQIDSVQKKVYMSARGTFHPSSPLFYLVGSTVLSRRAREGAQGEETAMSGQRTGCHSSYLSPISVIRATTVDSTPRRTAGSGEILNSGEWWLGTGAPPSASRSKSSFGVPPIDQ